VGAVVVWVAEGVGVALGVGGSFEDCGGVLVVGGEIAGQFGEGFVYPGV